MQGGLTAPERTKRGKGVSESKDAIVEAVREDFCGVEDLSGGSQVPCEDLEEKLFRQREQLGFDSRNTL